MSVSVTALLREMERHTRQGRAREVARCKRELAVLGHFVDGENAVETTQAQPAPENAKGSQAKSTTVSAPAPEVR